jgi:hypothetical protein
MTGGPALTATLGADYRWHSVGNAPTIGGVIA